MTREEAKKRLEVGLICSDCPEDKQCYDSYLHSTCEYTDYCDDVPIKEAIKVTIKALEQEPILDKIRAEIERQQKWLMDAGYNAYNVDIALDAIKSVVKESEGK